MKIKTGAVLFYLMFLLTPLSLCAQVIASGGRHSMNICADSTVRSWGYNGFGQLGNGNLTEQHTSVLVINLSGIKQVAGGLFHSLFVKSDGTVWSSGRNANGPLGDGTSIDKNVTVQVKGLTQINQAAGGGEHSLFLRNDGTVWVCGLNSSGQLGDGTNISKNAPVMINGLTEIIQVAAGAEFSLFLKRNGTVWACGHNGYGQFGNGTTISKNIPVQVAGLTDIVQLSAGEWHAVFVKNDGTVFTTGRNNYGQLGDGSTLNKSTPTQVVGLSGIIQSDAGGIHTVFVKSDGTVWSCGLNSGGNNDGQLGDGTNVDKLIPVQVISSWGTSKIIYADACREHSLYLEDNGTIWGSGRNNYGQLGYGSFTTANFFTPVKSVVKCAVLPVSNSNIKSKYDKFYFYPNPTDSETTLMSDINLKGATLIFYNCYGQQVHLIKNSIGHGFTINKGELRKGIFFVKLLQNNLVISNSKLIIM